MAGINSCLKLNPISILILASNFQSRSWSGVVGTLLMIAVTGVSFGVEESPIAKENEPAFVSRVFGAIALPNGEPATNATVYLLQTSKGATLLPTKPMESKTDQDGKYFFENVAAGNYRIWSETAKLTSLKEKLRGEQLKISKDDEEKAGKEQNLSLHEGCRYAVKVLEKASGKGVAKASITFGWTDIKREYFTNDEGFVEIGGLSPGDWFFVIRADGYAINQMRTPKQELGSKTELVFELEPGCSLNGVVRDESGAPVPNVEIYVSDATSSGMSQYAKVYSDKDGAIQVASLPRGKSVRFFMKAEGFITGMKEVTTSGEGAETEVELTLKKRPYGGDCILLVSDIDGTPIEGATAKNTGSSSNDVRTGKTDNQGKVRLNDLYSSHRGLTAMVSASGFVSQRVKLEAGSKEEPKQVQIALKKGAMILGRLVDPDGNPAPKIPVYFDRGDQGFDNTGGKSETDKDGYFRFSELPNPCTFTFYTAAPYAPIKDLRLPVGTEDEIVVVMEKESVIRIRAIDANTKQPITEFNVKLGFTADRRRTDPSVSIRSEYVEPGINILGKPSIFRIGQLPHGMPYQITVSAKGYEKQTLRRVEAAPEAESEILDVALMPAAPEESMRTVSGRLVDENGQPIHGARMHLIVAEVSPDEGHWTANWSMIDSQQVKRQRQCLQFLTTTSNSDGSFKFSQVKIADYMEIAHTGGKVSNGRFVFENPKQENVFEGLELLANRGGNIRVVVDRKKFPDASGISLFPQGRFENRNASLLDYLNKSLGSDQEELLLENIPPGTYSLSLGGERTDTGNGAFTIKSLAQEVCVIDEDSSLVIHFPK